MIPLPGYKYSRLLGKPGHFGEVWLAENELSGEQVAIKHVDKSKLPVTSAAWEAEARAMQACDQRNLVKIKHAAVTNDGPALVMEYVPGGSWESRYKGAARPVGQVVQVGMDLCWGLHHLHGRGLVHRDIKPANVLLRDSQGVLGDFGLAGRQGMVAAYGYDAHMPPEARIPNATWTTRSDIYALGITLYRMICGDDFCGYTSFDPSDSQASGRWPDRDRWPLHIHRPLRRVLRAAMHPDPTKRPASAAELRKRLAQARPTISFCEIEPNTWVGERPAECWRLRLCTTPEGLATLRTERDKGRGLRTMGAASIATPAPEVVVQRRARELLDTLARTGTPAA